MKKFEYRLLDTTGGFFSGIDYEELTEHINALGREGWEMVSVVDTIFTHSKSMPKRGLLFTFKREIQ